MDVTQQQFRRRQKGKKVIGVGAVTASVAMVATALIAPAASADDKTTTSVSAAHGHGLEVELADTSLVGSADAFTEWKASGQIGNRDAGLDLSLLGGQLLDLDGIVIPLISTPGAAGLLELGDLGALKGFADSPFQSAATASSGIVGDDGAVLLSPADVPSTFMPASLDVSALIEQVLGSTVRQTVLDKAGLEIGALGSTAHATGGVADPATEYMVAGVDLKLHSPAVGTVASSLDTALDDVGTTLNTAVGTTGVLGAVVAGLPDLNIGLLRLDLSNGTLGINGLDQAIADVTDTLLATPLVDANGIVSINLNAGTIDVDLAKVVAGGDLNGLPANTELIDGPALTKITAAVTEALGTLTTKVTTVVTDLVNNLSVTIELPVKLSVLGLPAADEIITIDVKLGQLTGAVPGSPVVNISQNNPSLIGDILAFLGISDLLGTITGPVLGSVTGALKPVITTLLGTLGTGLSGTLDPVVSGVTGLLAPVLGALNTLVSVKVNEQTAGDLGATSKTVRALAVTLVPAGSSGLARVELASSTVKHKFDATPPGDANTNASASASASADADGGTASAQVAAQAAAMADNSASSDADASTGSQAASQAAAKSAANTTASTNAAATSTSSAKASAVGANDSNTNTGANAQGTAQGDSDAGAASKAAAQTTASADASTGAAGTSTSSGATSTTTTQGQTNTNANTSTNPNASSSTNGASSKASASTKADANVNASASASADSKANAAAKAAANADASTAASAKATAKAQAAAQAAATTKASTNASTKANAASKAAAQAAALANATDNTNASATAKANSNASAAAKAAAIANASSNASGNNPNPNTLKCLTPSPKSPFLDTPTNHKFYTEIDWMYCMKYTTGIKSPEGLIYGPQMRLSREAMAAFIYRMEADPNWKLPKESPFADMKPGDKFYKEIVWMHDQGLSTGIKQAEGKPIYGPKLRLSREAMAAFIYRLEDPKGYSAPRVSKMQDMKPGDKFYTEISWMVDEGLSTGIRVENGNREYWPKNRLSREAMAAFIHRLVNDYRA